MARTSIALLILLLLACGENKTSERPASPRIKKETKVEIPKQNQKFTVGDKILIELKSNLDLDSVQIELDGQLEVFSDPTFEFTPSTKKVGKRRIKATVFFGGKKETHYRTVICLAEKAPESYGYQIINTYPHDETDYTQGLLIDSGFLYESTGQNSSSRLEKKVITTGETLAQVNLSDDFFGEGLALINDQFYQLTYTSGACFVYNKNLEKINSFSYQNEGWGMTAFEGTLLMTNSTETVFKRDPKTFSIIDQFDVYDNKDKVDSINELEIIDGMIYANVYQEDYIVVIDPETGAVVKKIDMSGLLTDSEAEGVDVLNGIAYDAQSDRIFVTGKLWPKLFEVKFVPKNLVQ